MSLTLQQTIDITGAGLFSLAAIVAGGLVLANSFMDKCPQNKQPGLRIVLLCAAAGIAMVQSFAYWGSFGGYGTFLRPADNVPVQFLLILTWPISWYCIGESLGNYLWHTEYWKMAAARSLGLAGLFHYLGIYVATTTPGIQTAAFVMAVVPTLSAVYIAIVLRRRRDTNAIITIVVGIVGIVLGFIVSYLLSGAFLGIVTGTGYSIWLLLANIVVYIVYFAWLVLTGRDMPKKRGVD